MRPMPLLNRLCRTRAPIHQQCIRLQRSPRSLARTKATLAAEDAGPNARDAQWEEQAARIHSGAQRSILEILEERGFIKDVAGSRKSLDWLLTNKRIGAYVGVDPTAPSLHVGHLLPLMALYWMYLHGYHAITLLGGGTVQIGDPSGRTSARSPQQADVQAMNVKCILQQLIELSTNVKSLGVFHKFPEDANRKIEVLNNRKWLEHLSAVELMRGLGSGMRLGSMLARDSVKVRMENGEGMAFSEFSYPLFQAYDWWHMYSNHGVQLQLGGSDQYGNLCAGMDAVSHMRKIRRDDTDSNDPDENPLTATFGLATPLLTTASGEKFGKSAGNAVWLDKAMLSSFDLYQYFLRTADDDVARYLKLFTFLPISHIETVMEHHAQDASKRVAQHLLAKQIVALAHGAEDAKEAEQAHQDTFSHGMTMFNVGPVRAKLAEMKKKPSLERGKLKKGKFTKGMMLLEHKQAYVAAARAQFGASVSGASKPEASTTTEPSKSLPSDIITLPLTLLKPNYFPRVLYAAGLANSISEARRLIMKKGAYVVIPNSGALSYPLRLRWEPIPETTNTADPRHYLIDYEILVLRSGKSKVQVCRIVTEEDFKAEGLTCPGWEEYKKGSRSPDG